VAALGRLMPNIGGPGGRRRRLYAGVVQSIIMYGAPVWADDIGRSRKLRERLAAIQRRIALRVISAYRTVSRDAAAILAGLLPGDILARSYRRTYLALRRAREVNPELTARARTEIRKRERRLAVEEWKLSLMDRGEQAPGAIVREALTPVLELWMEGGRGGLTFRATQLITGHGSFGDYLFRIGRVASPACPHCGGVEDSARHTLQECPEWADERGRLVGVVGPDLRLAAVLGSAASSPCKWNALVRFAEKVMVAKETAERARQAAMMAALRP